MFTTTYPATVTLLLIALVLLFIFAIRKHLKDVDYLERKLKESRSRLRTMGWESRAALNTLSKENHETTESLKRLKMDYRMKVKDCEGLRETVERLREDLKELRVLLRDRRSLTSIKFTANVPHLGWTKTEFSLGLGPCGKTVESLESTEHDDRYVITQRCTDGERKTFEYMKVDVAGRIEKAYRAPDAE